MPACPAYLHTGVLLSCLVIRLLVFFGRFSSLCRWLFSRPSHLSVLELDWKDAFWPVAILFLHGALSIRHWHWHRSRQHATVKDRGLTTCLQDLKDFARQSGLDVVYSEVARERDPAGGGKGYDVPIASMYAWTC